MTPWHCDVVGSFAWRTCTERWPRIVDALSVEAPAHRVALTRLRDEIADGVVPGRATNVGDDDERRFGVVDAWRGRPWTALPWYVGESWLYARIRSAVGYQHHRRDPFRPAKAREEAGLFDGDNPHDPDPIASALWRSLWGNRADLSLPTARDHERAADSDLLHDDRSVALGWLRNARRVAILLDNAGTEVFADLQLARALHDAGAAVTLYAKDRPFFVSDAMPADIAIARRHLQRPDQAAVVAEPFLTGPGLLTTAGLPRAFREALGAVDVIIAKGDCNYRRLVGDAPWASSDRRSFTDAVVLPAPVIALRTLKAEVLVGVDAAVCARARAQCPDWLVSGRYGVVQCAGR